MHPPIPSFIDLLLSSFAVGATTWLFFVQSPVLIRWMGRDRFVPIQMRLARTLFATLSWVLAAVLALVWLQGEPVDTPLSLGAVVAFLGAAVTSLVILPRALRAGSRGQRETKERGDEASVADVAMEGTGPSARVWHLTVVGFVIVILGGLLTHMCALLPHS